MFAFFVGNMVFLFGVMVWPGELFAELSGRLITNKNPFHFHFFSSVFNFTSFYPHFNFLVFTFTFWRNGVTGVELFAELSGRLITNKHPVGNLSFRGVVFSLNLQKIISQTYVTDNQSQHIGTLPYRVSLFFFDRF